MARPPLRSFVFFLNDTATTEIYTLSLHDALPIYSTNNWQLKKGASKRPNAVPAAICKDRKSTRLNSSHLGISYAVFGLKKKKVMVWALVHNTINPEIHFAWEVRARSGATPSSFRRCRESNTDSPPRPFSFFNDTAPTEIYTLSLHDALPISMPIIAPPLIWLVAVSGLMIRPQSCTARRSEEHTSELQSLRHLVCRLLLE